MRRILLLPALLLAPTALGSDAGLRAVSPPTPPSESPTSTPSGPSPAGPAVRPRDPGPVDVIDEALWARFASHQGEDWWLHRKVIRDGAGHTQLDNARYIVRRFREAGLPDALALAAVVNSLMESSLLSDRVHPVSRATGLFQCWRNPRVEKNLPRGGAGNGTPGFDWGNGDGVDATTAQMKDRDLNTDRILFELLHVRNTTGRTFFGVPPGEAFGAPILARAAEGASVAELAALWGQRIERYRPGPGGTYAFRGKVAARLFGEEIAYADTSRWRQNRLPEPPLCPPPTAWNGRGLAHRPAPVGAWVPVQPWRGQDSLVDVWLGWGEPAPGCP